MDTLIRIKLEFRTYQNQRLKEQVIVVDESMNHQTIFEIKESDNVNIAFFYDHKKTKIYYEDYDGNEILVNEHRYRNLSSGREDYGAYFVGYFSIKAIRNDQIYEFSFLVKPHNLQYESVLNLRKYVDRYYEGLSQDMMNQTHFSNTTNKMVAKYNYHFLIEHLPKVMNYIHRYIRLKSEELVKTHVISRAPKKLSVKSLRWFSKQGLAKNENILKPDQILVEKTSYELNTLMNQLFKQLVSFYVKEVEMNLQKLIQYIQDTKKEKRILMKDVKRLEHQNAIGAVSNVVSKKIQEVNQNKVQRDYAKLSTLNDLIESYEKDLKFLLQMKATLDHYLYQSWLSKIKNQNVILKQQPHPYLHYLIQVKNQYLGKSSSMQSENKMFASKSTPKLFETFTFIMLIQILNDLQFKMDQTSENRQRDLLYIFSNPNITTLCNNGLYCDIYYDMELKRSHVVKDQSSYCTINSRHNCPDFILSFHYQDQIPLFAMVVEVKWRSKDKIYSEIDDTDVVINLKDYLQLGYKDIDEQKLYRALISQVIVMYPNVDEELEVLGEQELLSIGVLPSDNMEESFAYKILRKLIKKQLDFYCDNEKKS